MASFAFVGNPQRFAARFARADRGGWQVFRSGSADRYVRLAVAAVTQVAPRVQVSSFGVPECVEDQTMKVSLPLLFLLAFCPWLFTGQLTAQEPDVDKLKQRLGEIRKQQQQLLVEEKKLREELERLTESRQDKLLAEFTGTLHHDRKRDLYKIIMKHSGRKEWEQTIWIWIKDDPRFEGRLKTLVGKRVQVKGYLFQHDGKEFREGSGRIPKHALYTNNPELTENFRPDGKQ
jgi:hypothetical protein